MKNVYIAAVQSGLTFNVLPNEPFGDVFALPRDGKRHNHPKMNISSWVAFSTPASINRVAAFHWKWGRLGKMTIDDCRGVKGPPWHIAAFWCRENAEKWMEEKVLWYKKAHAVMKKASDEGVEFHLLGYQCLTFRDGLEPTEALEEAKLWYQEYKTSRLEFEKVLSTLKSTPS